MLIAIVLCMNYHYSNSSLIYIKSIDFGLSGTDSSESEILCLFWKILQDFQYVYDSQRLFQTLQYLKNF